MSLDTKIIYQKETDPWRNLAIEEYLLNSIKENQCILYLWQNQNTVVIGKNQNPWRECQTKLLEEEGGKLARRISGGGAVFHDLGNLNFTFLVDRKFYDLERQLKVILTAVNSLGISAQFSGRNDLVVDGRKFSGNAFCFRTMGAFHHGTILVNADIKNLGRYLQVSKEKIRSKGVKSVQARVINLKEYNTSLSIPIMAQALIKSFGEIYGGNPAVVEGEDGMEAKILQELYEKNSSWQWRYGESPCFDIEIENRFSWGGVEIGLKLQNARIEKATVYSDAMDEEFISMIPDALNGCVFDACSMSDCLLKLEVEVERKKMAKDIGNWLAQKSF